MDVVLTLATRYLDGTLTIAVTGELDIATSRQLLACLDAVFIQMARPRGDRSGDQAAVGGAVDEVVIDTGGVSFIDAHGLGALVALQNRARNHGIALRLADPSAAVRRILSITGLRHRLLPHSGMA
ncbi:STAS domain-containing protein [Actinomadura sp. NTSP31]|uniref:STAS domain-containing protein n=1 Tax=Actinomadura sp. NTSP31 TaxID=1735447 RepID=UPI0035BED839